MKLPVLTVTLFFAVFFGQAFAEDPVARAKEEAQKCGDGMLKNDYGPIISHTHPRVVTAMGGKEVMQATIKRGNEQMTTQGFKFEGYEVGQPGKVREIGGWLVTLIPETVKIKAPGGHLVQDAHLLGISEDAGKVWYFVDVGAVPEDQLMKLFPELKDKIHLPEHKQPVFTKDP
jgi:hypothetical protein